MKKETITMYQGVSLVAVFILGSSVVLGVARDAKQDSWMGALLALAAVLPLFYVYAVLMGRYPGLGLFEICTEVFGKFLGKVAIALFAWFAFQNGAGVLREFSEYIQLRVFPDMPQTVSLVCVAVLAIWVSRRGLESLGRWVAVMLPFHILVTLLISLMMVKDMHPAYLMPMGENLSEVPAAAAKNFALPLAQTVICLGLLGALRRGGKPGKPGKALLYGTLIGFSILFSILVRDIMVLGFPSYGDKWFPNYDATSVIVVGSFVSRIENLVGGAMLMAVFAKTAICLLAAAKGTANLFGQEDHRPYTAPLGLLMVALAGILNKTTMEVFDFIKVYPYFAFPFEVLLPLALCIVAEIKYLVKRKTAGGGAAPAPAKS